jgi:hypothetical protein
VGQAPVFGAILFVEEPMHYFRYDALNRINAVSGVAVASGGYGIQGYSDASHGGAGSGVSGLGASVKGGEGRGRRLEKNFDGIY